MPDSATHASTPAARPRARRFFAVALLLLALAVALPAAAAAAEAPSINVDTPAAGAVWAGKDTQTVAWTLSWAVTGGKLCVWMESPGGFYFVKWIDPVAANTSYSVSVPVTGVPPGDGYQVYVGWIQNEYLSDWTVVAASGSFTMQSAAPAPVIRSLSPTRAMVGKLVTISGKNFGASRGDKYVVFGATKAKIKSWSATRIRAVVPVGVHAGRCTVKVRDDSRASKGVSFTVTAPPGGDAGLVGTWNENSMVGWSQMYQFKAAGSFRFRVADISGVSTTIGLYRARGDKIRLFSQYVDGSRAANDTVTYSYRDGGRTLYIDSLWFFHKK